MKESIGGVAVFNIMIVFIITVFALLWAAYSYANAYKINTRIMNGIEISEGYNDTAVRYINTAMQAMGYRRGRKDCPATWEIQIIIIVFIILIQKLKKMVFMEDVIIVMVL